MNSGTTGRDQWRSIRHQHAKSDRRIEGLTQLANVSVQDIQIARLPEKIHFMRQR